MAEHIETEIRKALDAKAHDIEVPADLATRTMEAAEASRASRRGWLRSWLDARRMRLPATGYPRWLYAGGAVVTAVLLFVVGTVVTMPRTQKVQQAISEPQVDDGSGAVGAPGVAEGPPGAETIQDGPLKFDSRAGAGDASADVDSSGGTTERDFARPDEAIAPVPPGPPVPPGRAGQFPPKIIRTANVQIEVRTFERAWNRANDVASKHGGFVTNSSTELLEERLARGTLTMRVPAAKLDAALKELRSLGTLAQMQTGGEDVSAAIVDLKARIKTLETEELQLLELLRQANNLTETLEVRSRLDSVRQEIESMKAQREFYDDQVAYSTINATIFEEGVDPEDTRPDTSIVGNAIDTALRIGLTIVAGTLVVLGGLVPLAVLGILIWLVVRTLRRRRAA